MLDYDPNDRGAHLSVNEIRFDENGLCHAEAETLPESEVRHEILQGIVDVERGAALANLICWLVVALAAATLPNAVFYIAPLALRLLAMVGTRSAFSKLRNRMAHSQSLGRELQWLMVALFVGGAAWGATLIPVVIEPFLDPSRLLVGGATIAGITIIVSLLLPAPRLAASFIGGFFASFGAGLFWAPEDFAIKGGMGIVALFVIFLSYGLATIPRHRKAAETVVENRLLSEELSSALAHAEFLAFRDPLTGLPNRRAFFQSNHPSPQDKLRYVLTIDLDHFKRVNDTFGHPVGDKVLIGVARALNNVLKRVRSGGHIAARIGGEEFAVILDVSDIHIAEMTAQMVRHEIALIPNQVDARGLKTTTSVGLCPWHPSLSLDCALSHADSALYRAKERGRNRVEIAELAA